MQEHTIALLKECDAGIKMATNTIEDVRERIKDPGFCAMVMDYDKKHIKLGEECHTMLNQYEKDEKDPHPLAKLMGEIKSAMYEDEDKIAELLTDGCNMGMKSVGKYLNQYMQASEESIALARKLIKMEQHFMEDLRAYL